MVTSGVVTDTKHVMEGKTEGNLEVMERGGSRRKQLKYDLEENRGYCKLEGKAPDSMLWRALEMLWTCRKADRGLNEFVTRSTDTSVGLWAPYVIPRTFCRFQISIPASLNPLNTELNPICQ